MEDSDLESTDESPDGDAAGLDPRLLEILVCPQTKGPLVYDREKSELLSKRAGLAYPIRDGVAVMLVDEARALSDDEIEKL